jgi:hypothetical protein
MSWTADIAFRTWSLELFDCKLRCHLVLADREACDGEPNFVARKMHHTRIADYLARRSLPKAPDARREHFCSARLGSPHQGDDASSTATGRTFKEAFLPSVPSYCVGASGKFRRKGAGKSPGARPLVHVSRGRQRSSIGKVTARLSATHP